MSEAKYKYKKPKDSRERLEFIADELRHSSTNFRRDRPLETTKDYLRAIFDSLRSAEHARKRDGEDQNASINRALMGLAVISFVLIWNGTTDPGDFWLIAEYQFAIKLWGIALASVFLGVLIERTGFFKNLWTFGITKLVASVAISALIIFSTGKAAALVNTVFPIDASALPFTRAIVTGIVAFQYASPLLAIVALFALGHGLIVISWVIAKIKGRELNEAFPSMSTAFAVLAVILITFAMTFVRKDFSEEVWPQKIYRLAHELDFNRHHKCTNIPPEMRVVFLGDEQARVLVDPQKISTETIKSFVDATASKVPLPLELYVTQCESSTMDIKNSEQKITINQPKFPWEIEPRPEHSHEQFK